MFDTETTVDRCQSLLFGAWHLYSTDESPLELIGQGLFHPDDLAETHPHDLATLREYAIACRDEVRLEVKTRAEFVEDILYQVAYRARGRVVGYNEPFDLSRLAVGVTEGRGRNYGAFSLILWPGKDGHRERRHRPRITIKLLDTKGAFINFTKAMETDDADLVPEDDLAFLPDRSYRWPGRFVDLATLAFALTGEAHSLESACRAYGLPGKADPGGYGEITPQHIDYCRQDVAATAALYVALVDYLAQYGVDVEPEACYSPASISKAHLASMGVRPLLKRHPDFDPETLGHAMAAFFGGRAECMIRRWPVPVELVDVVSMYPGVNALLDLWRFHLAERIDVADATVEVRELLDHVSLEGCLDPELWPHLVGFALVEPDADVLPVRGEFSETTPTFTIAVTEALSDEPLWYSIPDLAASALLTGRAPSVRFACRLVPVGRDFHLKEMRVRGRLAVDPAREDPMVALTQLRQMVKRNPRLDGTERERLTLAIKLIVNSGSYGIYSEFNVDPRHPGVTHPVRVYGRADAFTDHVEAPEKPGIYAFPPLASCITGGARLVLALLERLVTDAGGVWAFCDTDSMAIVATEEGGLVACPGGPHRLPDGREAVLALSYAQVEAIRTGLNELNPFDRGAVPEILKDEARAMCFAISAKRYALFHLDEGGRPVFLSDHPPSESGLGHYLNPLGPDARTEEWVTQAWEWIVGRALGLDVDRPDWFDNATVMKHSVTSMPVLRALDGLNRDRLYRDQVKPFNFVVTAAGATPPAGHTGERFRLIAPYTKDSTRWEELDWVDVHDPAAGPHRITTRDGRPGLARVPTFGEMLERYATQPEAKALGPDGQPCGRLTIGLLRRQPVEVDGIKLIGKESNRIAERASGELTVDDLDERLTTYHDDDWWWRGLWPKVRECNATDLAQATGVAARSARQWKAGRTVPHRRHVSVIKEFLDSAEPSGGH